MTVGNWVDGGDVYNKGAKKPVIDNNLEKKKILQKFF